ncbi:MAG: CRISPR-associated endonuclease Cas1 [Kouleothrix sp.]
MHLIVEERGVFVSKHQGRLRVEQGKQRLAEVPIMHLEQVLICSNGVGLSSDVVRACAEEGIPIHFLNGSHGDDYGTLFASGLTGMALTKRRSCAPTRTSAASYWPRRSSAASYRARRICCATLQGIAKRPIPSCTRR